MVNSFQRFRISMFEAFGLLTGLCLAFALLGQADFVVVLLTRAFVAAILAAVFAVAMARPQQRDVLLSFIGGAVIMLVYDYYTNQIGYGMGGAVHRLALVYFTGDQNTRSWNSPESALSDLLTLELAIGIGLLSAWVTRSLRNQLVEESGRRKA